MHRHTWAPLLAKAKDKVIPVPTARVCLKCGEMKIGKKTIRISHFRLDMGGKQIQNLAAPTVATDAARKAEVDAAGAINKGRAWIAHGDNVITFPNPHSNVRYRWVATLSQAPMGEITPRNVSHTRKLRVFVSNESTTRGKVRVEGGFGFTSCGWTTANVGTTQRFDDVANTHTARTAATARHALTGYSLNGFGFTSCGHDGGVNVGLTQRFDDVANTHTARASATARHALAGYSLNGFGFTSCGIITAVVGTTERFDDVANTHTARATATARRELAGYSLNGFGFTSCGWTTANVGLTERFDDVANTHTARTDAIARWGLTGYSLNGFGFTSCGATVGTTERFDDVANTHTARTAATARYGLTGYSLNGFGFTSCGFIDTVVGTTERFDDVANTHTARAAATARQYPAGYSTNEYFINYLTFNE